MDEVILSRIQFATNISFHFLFPAITIALSWFLCVFKVAYKRSGKAYWNEIYQFWVKIFALCFAFGVVTGVTMSFQFGTNWSGFMEAVGNIAGPLLGFEVLTAFFLEASFLGIMLFGAHRVSPRLHTFSTFAVALGTTLSSFWILALSSWMHTPQGHIIIDGVAFAQDWKAILLTPSLPYRFTHTLLASGLTACFFIAGISAYRWLRQDRSPAVRVSLRFAITLAAVLAPMQIFVGDQHGLNTLKHQPTKIAAIEANWKTQTHAPLILFAIPQQEKKRNIAEISIPNGASLILRHHAAGEVPGLDSGEPPPVAIVFYAFRVMVGFGLLMLITSWWIAIKLWRTGALSPFSARLLTAMTFVGWIPTLAGWWVTEVGRQPWLVQGILRTSDAISPITSGQVTLTLIIYLLLYAGLLATFITATFSLARRAAQTAKDNPEKLHNTRRNSPQAST